MTKKSLVEFAEKLQEAIDKQLQDDGLVAVNQEKLDFLREQMKAAIEYLDAALLSIDDVVAPKKKLTVVLKRKKKKLTRSDKMKRYWRKKKKQERIAASEPDEPDGTQDSVPEKEPEETESHKEYVEKMTEKQLSVFKAVNDGNEWFTDIAKVSGINPNSLGGQLQALIKKGLLEKISSGHYAVTEEASVKTNNGIRKMIEKIGNGFEKLKVKDIAEEEEKELESVFEDGAE